MALRYAIAPAIEDTVPPPIPKAWAWADQYRSNPLEGPVVDLSQGFPGTAPHQSVLDALSEAAKRGDVAKYGPILGSPELREAVAQEMRVLYRLNNADVGGDGDGRKGRGVEDGGHEGSNGTASRSGDGSGMGAAPAEGEAGRAGGGGRGGGGGGGVTADDVVITVGGNMAFLATIMALCPPRTSSVMLPMPNYFSHAMSLSLQSVTPVHLACDPDDGFMPSLPAARAYLAASKEDPSPDKVTPRMILLINPSNPTGAILPPDKVREWYALAKEYGVALVVDETYRDFVEGETEDVRGVPHRLFEEKDWRETVISLGSFSTLAPLLPSLRPDLLASSHALAHRRQHFREIISTVPGWAIASSGGYFAYVSFPPEYLHASSNLGLKRKRLGSEDIAKGLAVKVGVIVLPGSFSMPDLEDDELWRGVVGGQKLREDRWLRFAVANVDDKTIAEVGPRLRRFNEIMGMSA